MPSKRELYIRDRDDFIKLLISVESYKGAIKKMLANISVKVVEDGGGDSTLSIGHIPINEV